MSADEGAAVLIRILNMLGRGRYVVPMTFPWFAPTPTTEPDHER